MEVQQRHDGSGVGEVELDVVLVLDEQGCLSLTEIGGTHEDSIETRGYFDSRCGKCAAGLLCLHAMVTESGLLRDF